MTDLILPLAPDWLIRAAVAGVWLYEGLWCKLFARGPGQLQVVQAVPRFGARFGKPFLYALGLFEVGLGVWFLTGWQVGLCALAQTLTLVTLNTCGILFARAQIHDPAGMVVKNVAFLLLAWVGAALSSATG